LQCLRKEIKIIMKRLGYLIVTIPVFLLCSCLDVFSDKTERIAGNIYFVNIKGSGETFIGRKFGDNNFTTLVCCNVKEVTGNKSLLLVKQLGTFPDTMSYYRIYPEEAGTLADTLTKEQYYGLLNTIEKSIHFVPPK